MSSNFAEFVGGITDLNITDVRFASLIKEFIILCRQTVLSDIPFKYRLSQTNYIYILKQSNYLYHSKIYLFTLLSTIMWYVVCFILKNPNYSMEK